MFEQGKPPQDDYGFREYITPTPFTGPVMSTPMPGMVQAPQVPPPYGSWQPATPTPHAPPPGTYPGAPWAYPFMPLVHVAAVQKKPLYFPLIRNASRIKQIVAMAICGIVMIVLTVGSAIAIELLSKDSATTKPNGTPDTLAVLVFLACILFIVPTMIFLCGAILGAVRAFLVICLVEGLVMSGIWIISAVFTPQNPVDFSISVTSVVLLSVAPITAAIVGRFYDHRRYAAWWKSFLTMLFGSAILVISLLALITGSGNTSDGSTLETLLASSIVFGCFALLVIPLIALPAAGVEGIIHAIIVAKKNPHG